MHPQRPVTPPPPWKVDLNVFLICLDVVTLAVSTIHYRPGQMLAPGINRANCCLPTGSVTQNFLELKKPVITEGKVLI